MDGRGRFVHVLIERTRRLGVAGGDQFLPFRDQIVEGDCRFLSVNENHWLLLLVREVWLKLVLGVPKIAIFN